MYNRKWQPSKAQKQAFKNQMQEIERFCIDNNISASASRDSYYFTLNQQAYRVSNHTIEASNTKAYHPIYGQIRETYHNNTRDTDVIYIHASKTRIIEIYNNLKAGYILDGRGNIKEVSHIEQLH